MDTLENSNIHVPLENINNKTISSKITKNNKK